MATGTFVIDRAALLMGDRKNNRFARLDKLSELNNLLTEVASRTQCFKKQVDIQIQDGLRTYEFPADMLVPKQMTVEVVDGQLIFSKTYETLVNSGDAFNRVDTLALAFHAPGTTSRRVARSSRGAVTIFFRDLVSNNEFMIDPLFNKENIVPIDQTVVTFGPGEGLDPSGPLETVQIGTTIEFARVPDSATKDDIWIDIGDLVKPRRIYLALESYADVISILTIAAIDRPGSVDLDFAAVNSGSVGDFIAVVISNAGPTGTSILTKTGGGTREDTFLYTFNMFEDDSSNDRIITLLGGDPDLTATGADATTGTFTEITSIFLDGQTFEKFRPVNIKLSYVADLPILEDESEELNSSIPIDVLKKLPERLASILMEADSGGDKKIADRLESRYEVGIERSARHRVRAVVPTDVRPG